MATKKFRVGIVGLGRMGSTIDDEGHTKLPYSIASAVEASPCFELIAGSDLIEERCTSFAERWGVNAVYQDPHQMILFDTFLGPELVLESLQKCFDKK